MAPGFGEAGRLYEEGTTSFPVISMGTIEEDLDNALHPASAVPPGRVAGVHQLPPISSPRAGGLQEDDTGGWLPQGSPIRNLLPTSFQYYAATVAPASSRSARGRHARSPRSARQAGRSQAASSTESWRTSTAKSTPLTSRGDAGAGERGAGSRSGANEEGLRARPAVPATDVRASPRANEVRAPQAVVGGMEDRPVTRDTMALALLHASELRGGRVIWRNDNLNFHLDAYSSDAMELAHYRYECKREAATTSRSRAQRYRKWKEQRCQEAFDDGMSDGDRMDSSASEDLSFHPRRADKHAYLGVDAPEPEDEEVFESLDSESRLRRIMGKNRAALVQTKPGAPVKQSASVKKISSLNNQKVDSRFSKKDSSPTKRTAGPPKTNSGGFVKVYKQHQSAQEAPKRTSNSGKLPFLEWDKPNSQFKVRTAASSGHKTEDNDQPAVPLSPKDQLEDSWKKQPNNSKTEKKDRSAVLFQVRQLKERLRKKCPSNMQLVQEIAWNKLAAEEKESIEAIFRRYSPAEGELGWSRNVVAAKLELALRDLGIRAKNEAEHVEIKGLCREAACDTHDFRAFYFRLLPLARNRLQDLRRPQFREAFRARAFPPESNIPNRYSINPGTQPITQPGTLTLRDCGKLCVQLIDNTLMSKEALIDLRKCFLDEVELMGSDRASAQEYGLSMPSPAPDALQMDFNAFERICHLAHEVFERSQMQILYEMRQGELRFFPEEHWLRMENDVLNLHAAFRAFDQDESGQLDHMEVRCMLLEFGFLSGKQNEDEAIMDVVQNADVDHDGLFCFREVVDVIWSIRRVLYKRNKVHLMEMFETLDKDHNGSLNLQEVTSLFAEMKLVPKDKTAQNEIKRLIDFAQIDEDKNIDFSEFLHLVGLVREKLRTITRIQEMELGQDLGLSEDEVREYRDAFWELDHEGVGQLDIQDLRKAMRLLKQRIDGDHLRKLFQKIDHDGNGVLDFSEFLRLMHIIETQKKADNCHNDKNDRDETTDRADDESVVRTTSRRRTSMLITRWINDDMFERELSQ